jgi:hypothetical protein
LNTDRSPRSRVSLGAPRSRRCFLTNTRPGVNNSLRRSVWPSRRWRKCYKMNPRFDLATIEGCSEIPACRGREVLSLLIEVDPISGKEFEQYPDAYPKEYRQRVEKFSRKLYLGGRSLETSPPNSSKLYLALSPSCSATVCRTRYTCSERILSPWPERKKPLDRRLCDR